MTIIRLFHRAAEKSSGALALAAMLSIGMALSLHAADCVHGVRQWFALLLATISAVGCVFACLGIFLSICDTTPLDQNEQGLMVNAKVICSRVTLCVLFYPAIIVVFFTARTAFNK